jgi:hypothetical protein
MKESICLYDRYIKDFRCKYYITKATKKFITVEDLINCFGVKIDKLDEHGELLSSAEVNDIGINEMDVRGFIKLLNDGDVTPITLNDIVSDMII